MAKSKGADWTPQPVEDDAETRGRVVANYGPNLEVEDAGGMVRRCLAPRKFADLVVGDEVEWSLEPDGTAVVTAVRPRRQALIRPDARGRERTVAANVDQVLVVFAPRPAYSIELIDRYLVAAAHAGLHAALVLNKADLLGPEERARLQTELAVYGELGYPVVEVSAHLGEGMAALSDLLRDHTSILVGQSGTGKSSLL
ncbi:MAG TPA: ribosome small subunit-dependent GTPase A, partial [Gammaproteobacteria bacterium]|nr:ribosome small subunit-dependent GTPase A [Gammaproteobacteria bacterium]